MRKFPGKLERIGHHYVLTGWQGRWMRENYPTNPNKMIAQAIGISTRTLCNLAMRYEIHKDKDYVYHEKLKKINRETIQPGTGYVTISTKLSRKDYKRLCARAKENNLTKYEFIQKLVHEALSDATPQKPCPNSLIYP